MIEYICMGNTVGSTNINFCNFYSSCKDAYLLGLWCADGYWWSSSVGLSNTDENLIDQFRKFFIQNFDNERIKYNRHHIFVNSRPLLREFVTAKNNLENLKNENVLQAYFAGRFDGDGSISKDFRSDCRIVYSNQKEAEVDQKLINIIGISKTKIYYYQSARTFCLYISRFEAEKFINKISLYSIKMQKLMFVPRRDLPSPF